MTKEECKEYDCRYRLANREQLSAKARSRYLAHREEKDAHGAIWRHNNPEKIRGYNLKREYGISQEEYDSLLLVQGGKCAICGEETTGSMRSTFLFVDHDHVTGKVRGLLCHQCNIALGWLESTENSGKAKLIRDYLQKDV